MFCLVLSSGILVTNIVRITCTHTLCTTLTNTVGLTASCFGLGATLSNFLGQLMVEHVSHSASLWGSLIISIIPIVLFSFFPETVGQRGYLAPGKLQQKDAPAEMNAPYVTMT